MANMYDNGDAEVTISEQGTLKLSSNNPTYNLTWNYTIFTVPTGKQWTLKASLFTSSSLVGTKDGDATALSLSGGSYKDIIFTATSSLESKYLLGNQGITLKAGDSIRLGTKLSAYTSGSVTHSILIQESNL